MSITNRNNRTVHGKFKFGYKTKHRFPTFESTGKEMIDSVTTLYPTGRAWYLPEESTFNKVHLVINKSLIRVREFMKSITNSYFPDNDEFYEDDCLFWENKLGLITSNSLTLEQRKAIILRKMAFPNNIKARQGIDYIQQQLDIYGFNVKVYENIFQDENGQYYYMNPSQLMENAGTGTQHGIPTQHSKSIQHGAGSFDVIANTIKDESYNVGGDENLWATFFISSKESLFQGTSVPASRKDEFKELILKLKPAHLVAFCLIKYQ